MQRSRKALLSRRALGTPNLWINNFYKGFQAQPMANTVQPPPNPHTVRPTRVRARRGQATDPHIIADRLRHERIAERIRVLQELVPSVNKVSEIN